MIPSKNKNIFLVSRFITSIILSPTNLMISIHLMFLFKGWHFSNLLFKLPWKNKSVPTTYQVLYAFLTVFIFDACEEIRHTQEEELPKSFIPVEVSSHFLKKTNSTTGHKRTIIIVYPHGVQVSCPATISMQQLKTLITLWPVFSPYLRTIIFDSTASLPIKWSLTIKKWFALFWMHSLQN